MKLSTRDQLLIVLVWAVLAYCKAEGPMTWTRFGVYGFVGSLVVLVVSGMFPGRRQ